MEDHTQGNPDCNAILQDSLHLQFAAIIKQKAGLKGEIADQYIVEHPMDTQANTQKAEESTPRTQRGERQTRTTTTKRLNPIHSTTPAKKQRALVETTAEDIREDVDTIPPIVSRADWTNFANIQFDCPAQTAIENSTLNRVKQLCESSTSAKLAVLRPLLTSSYIYEREARLFLHGYDCAREEFSNKESRKVLDELALVKTEISRLSKMITDLASTVNKIVNSDKKTAVSAYNENVNRSLRSSLETVPKVVSKTVSPKKSLFETTITVSTQQKLKAGYKDHFEELKQLVNSGLPLKEAMIAVNQKYKLK